MLNGSTASVVKHAAPRVSCRAFSGPERAAEAQTIDASLSRRNALALLLATPALMEGKAQAIQGITAGRIPGLSTEPDADGFYTYMRPEGKSGGHGVGWSEIPRYSFRVPNGWSEVPVSIADLGGTEIDLRYSSKDQGEIAVVVAPVLRFVDVGFNANIRIQDIGTPTRIITGFAPELFGAPLDEEDILETSVKERDGLTYYFWHVRPNRLVSATAVRNRIFILTVAANTRQWRKHSSDLRTIQQSFDVPYEIVKQV